MAIFVAVIASQVIDPVAPAGPHTTALVTPNAVATPAARQSDTVRAETAVFAFQHIQLADVTPVYTIDEPRTSV